MLTLRCTAAAATAAAATVDRDVFGYRVPIYDAKLGIGSSHLDCVYTQRSVSF